MQRIIIVFCVFMATSAFARNLSFRRRIVYEASLKVVNFKCEVGDPAGNHVRQFTRPGRSSSEGGVRKKISFRMTVRNAVLQPVAARAVVRFYDKEGVLLFETKHDQYQPKIASKKTQVFQWVQWQEERLIRRVHSAEIYCGDYASMLRRMRKIHTK